MSGSVTPVMGMIPIVIPTLTNTWNISIPATPAATRDPNRSLAITRMRNERHISSAYSSSTSPAPTKPYCSPTAAKMKSVWDSGTKPFGI